ncbi:hypothetical protein AB0K00_42580 [Dactylosporangium sp. NPDC049525]|uniref:hypothetical protein n=1 Tax=Dactylosporangium sp. NPDC049525 TaxID=3154730 RepID=UPI00342CB605
MRVPPIATHEEQPYEPLHRRPRAAATVTTVTVSDDTTHLIRIRATVNGAGPAGTITGLHPDTAGTTRDRLYAAIHFPVKSAC